MNKTFLAIIPARGGSKRLPRKNILDLCGKPLISWSIEAALKSKYISKVVVSSDDEEILNISSNFGADIIKRPYELANDTATTFDTVKHTINNLEKYNYQRHLSRNDNILMNYQPLLLIYLFRCRYSSHQTKCLLVH